jgi:hypothetical protein
MYPTIDQAIFNKLVGDSEVSSLVGTDVFVLQAPSGTIEPYILFKQIAGGFEHSSPRPEIDVTYRIECVATSREGAEEGASAIYHALHNQDLIIDGWNNYDTAGGGWYTLIDNSEGDVSYRVGGMYRIRADQIAVPS